MVERWQIDPELDDRAKYEAQDLVKEHAEWRKLLDALQAVIDGYQENNAKSERAALEILKDITLKAEKQPVGDTTMQQLLDAQQIVLEAAYSAERHIAAARGVEFNPADPNL